MKDNFLTLNKISYCFPQSKTNFFNDFNLSFSSKDNIIGILGSNGSGKSLLAKLITGLEKIENGTIHVYDKDITHLKTRERLKYVSMSFQMVNNVFLKHSVEDEINYTAKIVQKLRKEKEFSLSKKSIVNTTFIDKMSQHPLTLSGGEKRKLYFNLLKIVDPEIYILDEPTVGLDYYGLNDLRKEIESIVSKNKKIILITHNLKFLLSLTDQVIILEKNNETEKSTTTYNGSFYSYLSENLEKAKTFLSIPIEYDLFRKKKFSHQLAPDIKFNDYLTSKLKEVD